MPHKAAHAPPIDRVVRVAGDIEVLLGQDRHSERAGRLGPTLLVVETLCFPDTARTPTASTTVAVTCARRWADRRHHNSGCTVRAPITRAHVVAIDRKHHPLHPVLDRGHGGRGGQRAARVRHRP